MGKSAPVPSLHLARDVNFYFCILLFISVSYGASKSMEYFNAACSRSCGAYGVCPAVKITIRRFTSRARGKDSHSDRGQGWTGITPACAVKSCSYPQQSTSPGDHPHACREKGSSMYCRDSSMGSPPRMRGKGVQIYGCAHIRGITPARAGKRSRSCACRNADGDHPRACGAYVHLCLRSKSMPMPYAFPAPIPPETAWRKRSASLICRMPS